MAATLHFRLSSIEMLSVLHEESTLDEVTSSEYVRFLRLLTFRRRTLFWRGRWRCWTCRLWVRPRWTGSVGNVFSASDRYSECETSPMPRRPRPKCRVEPAWSVLQWRMENVHALASQHLQSTWTTKGWESRREPLRIVVRPKARQVTPSTRRQRPLWPQGRLQSHLRRLEAAIRILFNPALRPHSYYLEHVSYLDVTFLNMSFVYHLDQ